MLSTIALRVAFVVALSVLNRVRGGGFLGDRLPGHPRFYVAPAVGLLSWALMPWPWAIAAGACFLAWSLLPWGRWFDLDRLPDDFVLRKPTFVEIGIETFAEFAPPRWRDHAAFTIRNALGFLPAAVILSPWFALAPLVWLALYELAWRVRPRAPIELAEILTGAAWGGFLVVAAWGIP